MSTELYGLVQSKITTDDIQAFKAQAQKMKDATENEIGTMSYAFFINEKKEKFLSQKNTSMTKPLWRIWNNSCRKNLFPQY